MKNNFLEEFDPFTAKKPLTATEYQKLLQRLFEAPEVDGEEEERRFIRCRISRGLEKSLTISFMDKIRAKVTNAFFLRHNYSYWLKRIEDGIIILYFKNSRGRPGFTNCLNQNLGCRKGRRGGVWVLITLKDQTQSGSYKVLLLLR